LKISEALEFFGLEQLPQDRGEVKRLYRELAKQHHPDSGGSEEQFKTLRKAHSVLKGAYLLLDQRAASVVTGRRGDEATKVRRAQMREEMLKRRAVENHRRNVQANRAMAVIGSLLILYLLSLVLRPQFIHWMVNQSPVERMATVVEGGLEGRFTIEWHYDGLTYTERIRGKEIDGRWIVGPAGMPMIRGGKYVVAFNANKPEYFELKDQFIHPETAELYFDLVKHQLSVALDLEVDDPKLICTYWSILDWYGVDGIAHIMFSSLPRRKNWRHNASTFEAMEASDQFQELVRSCRQ
jgi:hypothetical protein